MAPQAATVAAAALYVTDRADVPEAKPAPTAFDLTTNSHMLHWSAV